MCDVLACLDEPAPATVRVSPRRRWAAVLGGAGSPRFLTSARRQAIGDIQIDRRTLGPHRVPQCTSITLIDLCDRNRRPLSVARPCWPIGFSPDDRVFVYAAVDSDDAIVLRCIECEGEIARPTTFANCRLNLTSLEYGAAPAAWCTTGRLLVRLATDASENPGLDARDVTPQHAGRVSHDRFAATGFSTISSDDLHHYLRCQLGIVDVRTGVVSPIGTPGVFGDLAVSPDGRYAAVEMLSDSPGEHCRFSALKKNVTLWTLDASSGQVREVPGVRLSRDGFRVWNPHRPAELIWCVRNDSGDELYAAEAPFESSAIQRYTTSAHCTSASWTETGRWVVRERDRLRLIERIVCPDDRVTVWEGPSPGNDPLRPDVPHIQVRLLAYDAANVRSELVCERHGTLLIEIRADVSHDTTTCVESYCTATGRRTEVWKSRPGRAERVLWPLNHDEYVIQSETARLPPEVVRITAPGDRRLPLRAPRPARRSFLATSARALITYGPSSHRRTAVVYAPGSPTNSPQHPFVVWLHPHFVPGFGIQPTPLPLTVYNLPKWASPTLLLAYGIGVVDRPPFPFRQAQESVIHDLVEEAMTLVDALVAQGVADRSCIAVGGHCAGAQVAALLLSHTRVFSAGLLLSGIYNLRTAGAAASVATGGRHPASAPHITRERSPIQSANQIAAPVLLVYSEEEGTIIANQTLEFYDAVIGSGGKARCVRLPREGHEVRYRESLARMIDEMAAWCRLHMPPVTAATSHP